MLKEILDSLKNNADQNSVSLLTLDIPEIPSLPLEDFADFQAFEKGINSAEIYLKVVSVLRKRGGKTVREATVAVVNSILSDELAMEFNWGGINRSRDALVIVKKPFRSTKAKELVFAAVTLDFATHKEIEEITKDWLKASKNRHLNKGRVTNVQQQTNQLRAAAVL